MLDLGYRDVLLIVDVQNDFLPGGALGVPGSDKILKPLKEIIEQFMSNFNAIYYSQDWHPLDHCSFVENGGMWPTHCVQDTYGAEIAEEVNIDNFGYVAQTIYKGQDKDIEQYSAMDGVLAGSSIKVKRYFNGKHNKYNRIFIAGIATEYCIYHTAMGVAEEFLTPVILTDCIAAVDENEGRKILDKLKKCCIMM